MMRLTCFNRTTDKQTYQEEFESRHLLARAISRVPRLWRFQVEYQDSSGRWHNTEIG